MSIELTIKQAAGKPFKVSVPEQGSTIRTVKEAIFALNADLPVDIQYLFIGDVDLPDTTVLDHAGIQNGSALKLLRNEGSDEGDDEDEEADDESVGSLKDFIVSDSEDIEDGEDDLEEVEEEEEEVVPGGESGGDEETPAVPTPPNGDSVNAAGTPTPPPRLKTIVNRKRARPLVDLDPSNVLPDGARRSSKVPERFVSPELLAVLSNEGLDLADSDEQEESEEDTGSHRGETSEDDDFVPDDAEEEVDDDAEEEEEEEEPDDEEEDVI